MSADRYRACPKGLRRGIDVQRMAGEIRAIVVAKFGAAGVDVDDLAQETCAAICVKNTSSRSAFDPERSSFAHYVYLVARSKLGHMLGSTVRREQRIVAVEADALEALAPEGVAEGAAHVDATPRSIREIVEHLAALGRRARADAKHHYRGRDALQAARCEGRAEAFHATTELLGAAFAEDALPPLAKRLAALMAVVDRPLTPGQMSAALLVPMARIQRALEQLGENVVHHGAAVTLALKPPRSASRPAVPLAPLAQRKWAEEQIAVSLLGASSARSPEAPTPAQSSPTPPRTPRLGRRFAVFANELSEAPASAIHLVE